jgi:hypothetical protein
MPYVWVDPDVAVRHMSRTVYHCYEENSSNRLTYHYTTDASYCDEDCFNEFAFDIRDLDYPDWLSAENYEHHLAILCHAIGADQLSYPEDVTIW